MLPGKKIEYENEGVTIIMPDQKKKVRVEKLRPTPMGQMPGAPGGFQPGRVVINFQVVDEDDPSTVITQFDPRFELRIRYTPADLKRAQDAGRSLEMAFWDGASWVMFTREKHDFRLDPDPRGGGGFGVALIGSWSDPNIAWGP